MGLAALGIGTLSSEIKNVPKKTSLAYQLRRCQDIVKSNVAYESVFKWTATVASRTASYQKGAPLAGAAVDF